MRYRQRNVITSVLYGMMLTLFALSSSILYAEDLDPLAPFLKQMQAADGRDGVYILEKGEESLLARAWLVDHARESIDIQYFIWSTDNIGILAAEALLRAADRGVKVRVLVDDLMLDAKEESLIALGAHPNIAIRIYNPVHKVGVSRLERLYSLATDFRNANQRMHDKSLTVDRRVVVTGGRNMADEYYDYDQEYNFRDRDILLLGPTAEKVTQHFERFWFNSLAQPVELLLDKTYRRLQPEEVAAIYRGLHDYAADPGNYAPAVRRSLDNLAVKFPLLLENMVWTDVEFLSDLPGKNAGQDGLGGGGQMTRRLAELIGSARLRVTVQSPYLIMDDATQALFTALVRRGVTIRISTNSLASTDNLQAFSGYSKQRDDLIAAGIEIYEFKSRPVNQPELVDRYPEIAEKKPLFALHAKTLVVDGERVVVGTYNFDPRSANLNTEIGVLIEDAGLAKTVEQAIFRDMAPQNSWRAGMGLPGSDGQFLKRVRLKFWKMVPMDALL